MGSRWLRLLHEMHTNSRKGEWLAEGNRIRGTEQSPQLLVARRDCNVKIGYFNVNELRPNFQRYLCA